ncbi:MAG: hypothetical protein IKH13_10990 [Clostridia bacterium]|nr:hypothetical protein [Clostridia bacterium]
MRTNDEIFDIIINRRDEHKAEKSRHIRQLVAVGAVSVFLCVALMITVNRALPEFAGAGTTERAELQNGEQNGTASSDKRADGDNPGKENEQTVPETAENRNGGQKTERAGAPYKPESKTRKDTDTTVKEETIRENQRAESVQEEGGYSGGNPGNGFFIPATPDVVGAPDGINTTGEKITDAEAKAYFDENKTSIVSALAASGVPVENVRISEKGYSHVSYDGTEGKQLELRQNFRDYLVYNGGDLIAIITLYKENGRLYNTPAFGAPWFGTYNAYLNAHKGQKLLFVYPKNVEIVIAPDGSYRGTAGNDVSEYLKGVDNPYQYFYAEGATYTP